MGALPAGNRNGLKFVIRVISGTLLFLYLISGTGRSSNLYVKTNVFYRDCNTRLN